MNDHRITALAATVAALFAATACASSSPATGTQQQAQSVKCVGINSCKGTSECQSADGKSACQGQNECKGQGFVSVPTEKECNDKGGHLYGTPDPKADAGPRTDGATGDAKLASQIKCDGINECKGQGACKGADNACAGQNTCKGHGYLEVPTEADCAAKGGSVHAS